MIKWNEKRGLLDYRRKYRLVEREEPDLMRDLFPYEDVCRIAFDHRHLAPEPCRDMLITDTTFRDGQQARPPYTVEQISRIFDFLHEMGGPKGIIRQSEFFLYTGKDKKAVEVCREKGYDYPEITGWIRAKKEDLSLSRRWSLLKRESSPLPQTTTYI